MATEELSIELRWGLPFDIFEAMRPRQWYKQGVLLLGLIYSGSLISVSAWLALIPAVLSFCLVASAVYLVNDVADREEDRQHPTKKHRPIARGAVSVPTALATAAGLVVLGFVAAIHVGWLFTGILAAYVVQNVLYSTVLRDVALADVMVIGIGFVLRAVAGVLAIAASLSPWLIVCTMLAALLFALGKRRRELAETDGEGVRNSLSIYDEDVLDQLTAAVIAGFLMAYTLYTFFRADEWMMLTLPFAYFGVFRFHLLTYNGDIDGTPESLLDDRPSLVNVSLWSVTALAVLYVLPMGGLA